MTQQKNIAGRGVGGIRKSREVTQCVKTISCTKIFPQMFVANSFKLKAFTKN